MSKKIYAWLLRLYPAHFRRVYGEDALQLLRDRARDEKGFLPKLRLWLDLAADLAVSVASPRWRVADRQPLPAAPCFQILANETPRRAALLSGFLISLATLGALPFLVSHSGGYAGSSGLALEPLRSADRPPAKSPLPQRVEIQEVIEAITVTLRKNYIDAEVAQKMASTLAAHEKAGDYRMVRDTSAFADLVTAHLQAVSHDFHLRLEVMPRPPVDSGPAPGVIALFRREMQLSNCTFETVEMLPGNVGYLKLNSFPPLADCRGIAETSMAKLNDAAAIIFDVRYNGGGSPEMVALLASDLFDQPTHLEDIYNRAEDSTRALWTPAAVRGDKLGDKPAYVLVSRGTVSGAEEFAYDLKMLRRATIVGETTAGAAHLTRPFRIGDFFTIFVPVAKPINPISKTNWEGTGVTPDIEASPQDALAAAQKLAGTRK